MRLPILVLGVFVPLIAAAAFASAEDVRPPGPGTRVRVNLSGEERPLTGKYVALDKQSLTVSVDRVTRVIPREQIERLAVSGGRPSRVRRALVGAAIGTVVAVPGAAFSGEWDVLGPGALFGAIIGFSLPAREKWNVVDIGRVHVTWMPSMRRGAAITLAVAY